MIKINNIEYHESGTLLKGSYAYDSSTSVKKPAILIAHDWSGCNDFSRKKAEQLAALGYVGFSLDMYGDGKLGETKEEKMALIQPLMEDRSLLLKRMMAALNTVKSLEMVDHQRVAAIGFCFGGLCVLDLARSNADVKGVVSFHGLLNAPSNNINSEKILPKILVLHGHDDPMVPVEEVNTFETEMTNAQADWQLIVYSNTMHAFTNPNANDPAFGTVYNSVTDHRSWIAMKDFFVEIF